MANRTEEVTLDVSFIINYLNKLTSMPVEVKILEFYSLKVTASSDTVRQYKKYLIDKLKLENDTDLFKTINKRLYTKATLKIKSIVDSLIFKEFGSDVIDAKFISFVKANKTEVIIKLKLTR